MRPKLLKSFIVVIGFWFLATTLFWSLAQPETNLAALKKLQQLLPMLQLQVPSTASITESWKVQLTVLAYWTVPILVITLVSCLLGVGSTALWARRRSDERTERETGQGQFRKVTLTRGVLPEPKKYDRHVLDLGATEDGVLANLTAAEKTLLEAILGTISAAPDAYAGEGVSVSLLEHTLDLAGKALNSKRSPGLSAIVAAAHELGKLGAYKRDGEGAWVPVKNHNESAPKLHHDRVASQILTSMDEWWALPEESRIAVNLAVAFHSQPSRIPDLNGEPANSRRARDLLYSAEGVATQALNEQKAKTLEKAVEVQQGSSSEKRELSDIVFDCFVQCLPQLTFQTRGQPKGVKAAAWKVNERVFMLEIKLREIVMRKLPPEISGALTPSGRERVRVQPFTLELLKAFDSRGWLVREHDGVTLDTKEALWNVQAGMLKFKGVLIIDVPPQYQASLPRENSMYDVTIDGTLFTPAAAQQANASGTAFSKNDLLGVLAPSATPRPPAPSEGEAAAPAPAPTTQPGV